MIAFALVVGAYVLGSVPFALVIGKGLYRVDVRESGSGNIGTTNVFRVLGKKAGALVFVLDLLKGFVPVFLALRLISADSAALVAVLAAGAAIAGHTFSVFLRFKGGKGVATGGGAVLALMPILFLLAFACFWLVLLAGRFVSVASLAAAAFLSVAVFVTGQPRPYIVFTLAGTAVIFYAHRANIARLAGGNENRVEFPWNRN
ncbi:MAG: glycerol-3-phosphate 1-O-acyltransferase PlsY [Actinobacteria bacterium]|nr:glycerol-3-phosphate 1-O-acyltransferase PlsY [Actinomycetota bacterium]